MPKHVEVKQRPDDGSWQWYLIETDKTGLLYALTLMRDPNAAVAVFAFALVFVFLTAVLEIIGSVITIVTGER